ncbi:MAG: 2,3-bisphosphoglycerate-independent phosphoglycerate mutase [Candidatus Kerfeldbacteria bacterium]|nr:2,3-bisphosphoglycerate-independent phosphoglycerate mutase [Candidatus Kerfeldbacteria bacterium]
MTLKRQPAVLVVLDGFGIAPPSQGNAIWMAKTPVLDRLLELYPTVALQASGEAVGLPWGEMGNSEVGHLTLGAGKVLYQDLPRITRAISDQSFFSNPVLLQGLDQVRQKKSRVHILGMFSPAGVHSLDEHGYALLELCQRQGLNRVFVHVILDGRDSPYNSGLGFVEHLQKKIQDIGAGRIATVSGRYYAMDRDSHWERTAAAYQAIVLGQGPPATDPLEAIRASYAAGIFDEQMVPTVMTDHGQPVAVVDDHDVLIFFNFRADRARQLTKALALPGFSKFQRPIYLRDASIVTMTEYERDLPVQVAWPPERVIEPLAKVFSDAGLRQLHAAETEKYAHVTYFFNGGTENAWPGEHRVLVPSPSVPSYDAKPAMSARELTGQVIGELNSGQYALAVVNFANPDMVGHSGNIPATVEAVEVVDGCIGEIVDAVRSLHGLVMITGDHGNAEAKIDAQTGAVSKEHSANPVPLIVVADDLPVDVVQRYRAPSRDISSLVPIGVLADVAPTLLSLVGLPIPADMTGHNLFPSV